MTSDPRSAGRVAPQAAPGNGRSGAGSTLDFAIRPHHCFACGELNAHGLHLALHVEDQRCWVDVVPGREFEGWEGIVHGGIVSTILDEVMAWSLLSHDTWGVTARLSLTFRRPVEIGARIRAEGWVIEARRKVFRTAGRIVGADGFELAAAEGLYVSAPEERKRLLKERYDFRLIATPGAVDDAADDGATQPIGRPSTTPEGAARPGTARR